MPKRLGVKTGVIEEVALNTGLPLPEPTGGNGTILNPGIWRELVAPKVGVTVRDTAVGKAGPLLGKGAVPMLDISGLLDTLDRPAEGCVKGKTTEELGVGAEISPTDDSNVFDTIFGGATHFVQMVETDVRVMVESVVVTS